MKSYLYPICTLVLGVIALTLLVACGNKQPKSKLPENIRQSFFESCTKESAGNEKGCHCVLEFIGQQLSAQEASALGHESAESTGAWEKFQGLVAEGTKHCAQK